MGGSYSLACFFLLLRARPSTFAFFGGADAEMSPSLVRAIHSL